MAIMGTIFLGSAVTAAIVSALVSVLTSERRIAAENVLQERTKWRDKIRVLASKVHEALVHEIEAAELDELRAELSLLINPHDSMDEEILHLVAANNAARADEFMQRVALLLKHDWERAKHDASLWRCALQKPPERVAFKDYRPGVPHDYHLWKWSR